MQYDYNTYILIADVQALTDNFNDPEKVRKNVYELALDYLAAGIDPKQCHIYIQSMIPEVAENLGLGGNTDEEKLENLIKAIDELKEKIGIKKTIRDYGVDEQEFLSKLDEMSKQAFDDQCTGANPRYPLIEEIKQMYLEAYYGGER